MPRRRPTIYDIGKASGASPTTVSLVLNGRWLAHRISAETATRITDCAAELGYAVNLKARGLRLSRSGLAGMIIPHYRNRFFAGLAEAFEAKVRRHGMCPVVVSTQREPAIEMQVTKTLLAQQIEFLFVAGVRDPGPLNTLCRQADIRCINVDLPGKDAPSVVSDNVGGSEALTQVIIKKLRSRGSRIDDWLFLGGVQDDNSTGGRVAGFSRALAAYGITPEPETFEYCGYFPDATEVAVASRVEALGRLPAGVFFNGITALEGALKFLLSRRREELERTVFGTFDWDPFATHLPLDHTMVRQDVEAMIAASFNLLESYSRGVYPLVLIPTDLKGSFQAPRR